MAKATLQQQNIKINKTMMDAIIAKDSPSSLQGLYVAVRNTENAGEFSGTAGDDGWSGTLLDGSYFSGSFDGRLSGSVVIGGTSGYLSGSVVSTQWNGYITGTFPSDYWTGSNSDATSSISTSAFVGSLSGSFSCSFNTGAGSCSASLNTGTTFFEYSGSTGDFSTTSGTDCDRSNKNYWVEARTTGNRVVSKLKTHKQFNIDRAAKATGAVKGDKTSAYVAKAGSKK